MAHVMLAGMLCLCAAVSAQAGGKGIIMYVDDDAAEGGNGSSWKTPLRYLQDALDAAAPGSGVTEIRVAQGVHTPDLGANQTPGDRFATFLVPSGIALRGGYAGLSEKNPDARDIDLYETILSGDLVGNDGPPGSFQNYDDNSYHIMTLLDADSNTLIEGLTFSAAQADFDCCPKAGGGILCSGGSPTIHLNTFRYNQAYACGGVALDDSDATVRACVFLTNTTAGSGDGGGLCSYGGTALIEDCTFTSNRTFSENGGAISAIFAVIVGCTFDFNRAGNDGGAISGGHNLIIDCKFTANSAAQRAGAVMTFDTSTLISCTFSENASFSGGAISGLGPLINCVFEKNHGFFGGALFGGGTAANCVFRANQSKGFGGAHGGAAYVLGESQFIQCLFDGNSSYGFGGAAYVSTTEPVSFESCTIVNNLCQDGTAGGISGVARLSNNIVWANTPAQFDSVPIVSYSCVEGGWPGSGNIASDPQFVDLLGPDGIAGTEDDDLHLQPTSPCIDAGDNTTVPPDEFDLDEDANTTEPVPIDLDGRRRFIDRSKTPDTGNLDGVNPLIDMGVFEWQVPGDITGDGDVNVSDLLALLMSWGACPDEPAYCPADIAPSPSGDGFLNVSDLLFLLQNWD